MFSFNFKRMVMAVLAVAVTLGAIPARESEARVSGGQKSAMHQVSARSTDLFTETFVGGALAMVTVIGDGDTDLDLYVFDEHGNLIGSDTDYTDRCVVTFAPKWTGPFRIKVVNRGSVYNRYMINVR